ncbi:MAG: hypothetical protein FJW31_29955, partial [Acidobacteria bacterium]|nr:hypothetical protein [Acidobacteriota bacterium]
MSGCFGLAEASGHAGELLQGAIRFGGSIEPFLITLPACGLRSRAEIADAEAWSVEPVWKRKALRAARIAALEFGWTGCASLQVHSVIPVARGYGSSTADCVAAIRAVANRLGQELSREATAAIAVRAEEACDSTMFGSRPGLWCKPAEMRENDAMPSFVPVEELFAGRHFDAEIVVLCVR